MGAGALEAPVRTECHHRCRNCLPTTLAGLGLGLWLCLPPHFKSSARRLPWALHGAIKSCSQQSVAFTFSWLHSQSWFGQSRQMTHRASRPVIEHRPGKPHTHWALDPIPALSRGPESQVTPWLLQYGQQVHALL